MPFGGGSPSTGGVGALLFDSTLSGSAASIDTGANGIGQAYNVLDIYMYLRGDTAAVATNVNITFNNDTGSNYDYQVVSGNNVTAGASNNHGVAQISWTTLAASATSSDFGVGYMTIPAYTQTTGFKNGLIVT